MRLFIAVRPDAQMINALIHAQNDLYEAGVLGHYTPEENLHMTLAFIGEYPDSEGVIEVLEQVSFAPFEITLDQIGTFGDLWWAGVSGDALPLLAKKIRRALASADIPFDRKKFLPHITVLRKAVLKHMPSAAIQPATMTVDSFILYRSDFGKHGMIYTPLETFPAEDISIS